MPRKSLRTLAQGQPCYLRLPSICNRDDSTTVLAHIRRGGVAGMGEKPDDIAAVPMCSSCHDAYDRRITSVYQRDELDAEALRALIQWLTWLRNNEILTVIL